MNKMLHTCVFNMEHLRIFLNRYYSRFDYISFLSTSEEQYKEVLRWEFDYNCEFSPIVHFCFNTYNPEILDSERRF